MRSINLANYLYPVPRNSYRPEVPFLKRWLENYRFTRQWMHNRKQGKPDFGVFFWPHLPSKRTALYKALTQLGAHITNNTNVPVRARIFWEDATHRNFQPPGQLHNHSFLNARLTDISKEAVERLHVKVFGYGTFVDPQTHRGQAVMKSDENATHDGRIIQCPTQPELGYVYQQVINNQLSSGEVYDIRVPIIGPEIPFVYLKFRPEETRFFNANSRAELHPLGEILKPQEAVQLAQMAQLAQLDYGELDVLRDADTGRLFVVDINPTPYGPPNNLPPADAQKAITLLAQAFQRRFLRPAPTN